MNDTRDVELNAIGVLKRREIEARILAPLVEALGREFGRERVLQIVGETIVGIARDQGRQLVQISGGNSLQQFAAALPRSPPLKNQASDMRAPCRVWVSNLN